MTDPHRRLTFARGSLGRFIQRYGLSLQAKQVAPEVVHRRESHPGERHYVITLYNRRGGTLTIPWSQGALVEEEPNIERILETLGSDAGLYYEYGTPEDLGMAYGIDPEDWEGDFNAIKMQTLAFREFLGEQAFDDLMNMAQRGFEMEGDRRWLNMRTSA